MTQYRDPQAIVEEYRKAIREKRAELAAAQLIAKRDQDSKARAKAIDNARKCENEIQRYEQEIDRLETWMRNKAAWKKP